jgi:hypothetical protein
MRTFPIQEHMDTGLGIPVGSLRAGKGAAQEVSRDRGCTRLPFGTWSLGLFSFEELKECEGSEFRAPEEIAAPEAAWFLREAKKPF